MKTSIHKYGIKTSNHKESTNAGNGNYIWNQQLKTKLNIYRLLYKNLVGNANQKTTVETHTKKKKQPKHNTKDGDQTTREENKREREEKRPTKKIIIRRKWQ